MTTQNDIVTISQTDSGILNIQLNRPEQLNALSHDVLHRLLSIFTEAKQDTSVKAILLTGKGKGFCAGADIKQLATLTGVTGLAFARFGQQVFNELERLGKPSLAAMHGFAFGGGCELAMAANIRIAAENTVFGQPEIKLGIIPGFGGTQRLSRLIGPGRAIDICLTGKRFKTDEALQWGFITEITTASQLEERAMAILNEIIQYSPAAIQSILSTIGLGYNLSLDEAFEIEATHFGICCSTADKEEGVRAFLEKRAAQFTGN